MNQTIAYGINPQSSLMYPCSEEVSQVLTVCHSVAVVVLGNKMKQKVYGIKFNQSEKSQKPWSEDIAQCLSAQCHDAAVVMLRKKKDRKVVS